MKQLDPKATWLFFISYSFRFILPISILIGYIFIIEIADEKTVFIFPEILTLLWIAIPVLLILLYILARLSNHFYHYELTDDGFRKELGIIWKKYVTIPYDRIQNVDIYRGIWARLLGLSDLHIQTAGMSAVGKYGAISEGRLPGITVKEAEQLRDELLKRARHKSKAQVL